jgi:photosystem II stability/assembly factor-like uncharacterized protein
MASVPPVAGKAVPWSHATLPSGFGMGFHLADLEVAASDGATAYSCAVAGTLQDRSGPPRVIVTHDAGAHWAATAPIAASWSECDLLIVDKLDPTIVIAESGYSLGASFVSFNGGGSWQTLPAQDGIAIEQLATIGRHSWALVTKPNANGATEALAESLDGLRSWREIDVNLPASDQVMFWVNPGNASLLVQTYAHGVWTSSDDGAHWQQMNLPASSDGSILAVQQPRANAPWRLCADSLVCTLDGGKTWVIVPLPQGIPRTWLAGLADDDTVVMLGSPDGSRAGLVVYRCRVGSGQWRMMGKPPADSSVLHYVSSRHGGELWMLPAESAGAGAPDDPRAVYSAAYPAAA